MQVVQLSEPVESTCIEHASTRLPDECSSRYELRPHGVFKMQSGYPTAEGSISREKTRVFYAAPEDLYINRA